MTTVFASYEDPNHLWPYFYDELSKRLQSRKAEPLLSSLLPTKLSGATNWKAFPLTNIQFHQFSEDIFARRDVLKLHLQHHVHISLIACEELETYKKVVLGQVSKWLEDIHSRRNQHTLLIQVTSSSATSDLLTTRSKPISRADLVMERLMTDFGGNKNNRIVQLRLKDKLDESWTITINSLADAIYSSFWGHVSAVEDDVRRLEAQQKLPGWNFCTYFITKEALALIYQSAQLLEDALNIYDELEQLFWDLWMSNSQTLNDHSMQWVQKMTRMMVQDTEKFIIDLKFEKVRDLILQSDSNLYEFMMYLFGCQFRILKKSERFEEILLRTPKFITRMVTVCREPYSTVMDRAEWAFTLATRVVTIINGTFSEANSNNNKGGGTTTSREIQLSQDIQGKGNVYLLAQQQLEFVLGIFFPELKSGKPLVLQQSLPTCNPPIMIESVDLGLKDLWTRMMNDKITFMTVYIQLLECTLEGFDRVKLARSTHFVLWEKASALYVCGNYERALEILNDLLNSAQNERWPSITTKLIELRVACLKNLGRTREMLNDILNAWKFGILTRKSTLPLAKQLLTASKISKESLDVDLEPLFKFSNIQPKRSNQSIATTDEIHMKINWDYDVTILLDSITLLLAGNRKDVIFEAKEVEIGPKHEGKIILFCAQPPKGTFTPMELNVRIGAIKFSKSFLSTPNKQYIELGYDSHHANVTSLSIPDRVILDKPRIKLVINTGEDCIDTGSVQIVSPDVNMKPSTDYTWYLKDNCDKETVKKVSLKSPDDDGDDDLIIPLPSSSSNCEMQVMIELSEFKMGVSSFNVDLRYVSLTGESYSFSTWISVELSLHWAVKQEYRKISNGRIIRQILIGRKLDSPPIKVIDSWVEELLLSENDGKADIQNHNFTLYPEQEFYRIVQEDKDGKIQSEPLYLVISSSLLEEGGSSLSFLAIPLLMLNNFSIWGVKGILTTPKNFAINVGCLLPADLSLSYYEGKEGGGVGGVNGNEDGDGTLVKFKYELDYSSDCWIISGKSMGTLSLGRRNPSKRDLPLLLVPVRSGDLGLPLVQLTSNSSDISNQRQKNYCISSPHIISVKSPPHTNEISIILTDHQPNHTSFTSNK